MVKCVFDRPNFMAGVSRRRFSLACQHCSSLEGICSVVLALRYREAVASTKGFFFALISLNTQLLRQKCALDLSEHLFI